MAEKKIQGRSVRYDRMGADEGLLMLLRLLKILGPASGIIDAIAADDEKKGEALALAGIASFVTQMDSDAVFGFIMDMVKRCRIDGEDAVPGVMELSELLQVAMFAMRTEFGSFFADGAGSVLQKARPAA